MKQVTSLLALLCLLSFSLLAQKGTITGKIIDKATGEELIGASIRAESPVATTGAVSDIEGKFIISTEPSTYKLTFIYSSYKTEQVEVVVKPGEVSYVNFAMEEANSELAEVVITYTV